MNELPRLGIDVEAYDPSVIYRALRDLEMDGWVTSYEGSESQGPQRRMYHLTADGKDYLEAWIKDLRYSKDELERIIRFYEEERGKLKEEKA
jgi:DNA-binding PadR family transcriptional regulator